jgi:hypothetical protein
MDGNLQWLFSGLPIGVIILIYLGIISGKIRDLCGRVNRLEDLLFKHIEGHRQNDRS